ncbi:LysR substrate-binding domain-containing protein [Congregibacter sp.]|uniref:LysR substrate-binding domain-containing protein n=1 Tax=Congregibacter sp. TaxID=2744308 RepID=UPI003858DD3E
MAATDLNDYFYFVHVVEKGGFSAAAQALGMPKSRLSRHIAALEARLDTRLIQRTTRQFKVTDIGEVFYQHARALIDEMENAEAAVKRKKNTLSGNVTLSCSVGVAQFAIKEILARFLSDHPLVTVSQQVTNQNVDLVASGVDLSIRGHAGPLPDSALVQRKIATVEWNLFCAVGYQDVHGAIDGPDNLADQPSLALGWQAPRGTWSLENFQGERVEIDITPRLKSEDMATLKEAAIQGLGIVALPAYTCRREVHGGRLERVLNDWHAGVAQLSLVQPSRRGVSPPVEALRDYILAELPDFVAGTGSSTPTG